MELSAFFLLLRFTLGARGAIAVMRRLCMLALAGVVLFRHLQRSEFKSMGGHHLFFWCSKGKRRVGGVQPGFKWGVPRYLTLGVDALGPLEELFTGMAKRVEARLRLHSLYSLTLRCGFLRGCTLRRDLPRAGSA